MSAKWMGYFFDDSDLEGSELLLALAIADHADSEGCGFPGVQLLADKIRHGKRQTQRLIQSLEDKGYLEINRKQGRGHLAQFQLKKVTSATPFKKPEKVTLKGDISDIKGDIKGDISEQEKVTFSPAPIYKDEPLIEPYIEPHTENARAKISETQTTTKNVCEILPPKDAVGETDATDEYEKAAYSVLEEKRMDSPFDLPNWGVTIGYVKKLNPNPENFRKCIEWIEKWAKGRVTAKMVADHFGKFLNETGATTVKSSAHPLGGCDYCQFHKNRHRISLKSAGYICEDDGTKRPCPKCKPVILQIETPEVYGTAH